MGFSEVVAFARNFGVMVRVQGPDPRSLKMRKHAFHQYHSGKTTLSASGMLIPDTLYNAAVAKHVFGNNDQSLVLVVTVASVVEPFLARQHRENIVKGQPELIPGAQIDIMVEDEIRVEKETNNLDKGAPFWLAAHLLSLIDVPISSLALQSLIEPSSSSSEHGWEVGWSLASYSNDSNPLMDAIQAQIKSQRQLEVRESSNSSLEGKSTTRIAILGVFGFSKDLPNITTSLSDKRGGFLVAMGSPFGILSPMHFFNSTSVGSIANCYPSSSSRKSLLMADIRCLPGMEGGPVFGEHAHLVGILIRPLRQKTSGAEIQLVIPWEAITAACSDLLQKETQRAEKRFHFNKEKLNAVGKEFISNRHDLDGSSSYIDEHSVARRTSSSLVEKAMASVCLVTIDDGVWASGVLLNNQGLILTNAHLVEPWRFGKTIVNGGRGGTISELKFALFEESASPDPDGVDGNQKSQNFLPKTLEIMDSSEANKRAGYKLSSFYEGFRNVCVRLDHIDPWIWCAAKVVYVCKGALDIALLQLEFVPDQLYPIVMDFVCPSQGSEAYVIGHGLFGPKCDFFPSVCSGVVAKVVKAKMPLSYQSIIQGDTEGCFPAMLETTAAVHPGGSGGAVVNSEGHMIGLVTSNARHGGGTVIPHLNFSIPCAALAPIFKFSQDMQDLSILQDLDQPNDHLSSVWALMPPQSPKPGPALPNLPQAIPEDNNKDRKGFRFAKFIAERQEEFKKPTQPGKVESLSRETILSKL